MEANSMATIEIDWTKSQPISIRDYASRCGFNLLTINLMDLADENRKWIERKVITGILADIDKAWKTEWEKQLSQVDKGIYVITMAGNLCVQYKHGPSQVIYIGRGQIRKRFYQHLKNWVANFSESLQDIKFRFWMTEVKIPGSTNAFKDVESDLICNFRNKFGEFPLLNKKNGDTCQKYHSYNANLTKPFKNEHQIKSGWYIRPMADNEWFREIEEDDV